MVSGLNPLEAPSLVLLVGLTPFCQTWVLTQFGSLAEFGSE